MPSNEIAGDLGKIGSICEIFAIVEDLFLGFIFDAFGRKIPLIFGLIIAGLSIGIIPFFHKIFPSFLILRTLIWTGLIIGINAPFLPDYV